MNDVRVIQRLQTLQRILSSNAVSLLPDVVPLGIHKDTLKKAQGSNTIQNYTCRIQYLPSYSDIKDIQISALIWKLSFAGADFLKRYKAIAVSEWSKIITDITSAICKNA